MKKIGCVLWCLCLAAVLLTACGGGQAKGETKTVTLCVIHKDGTEKEVNVETAAATLEDVLKESGMVEGRNRSFGYYIETVDGERINEDNEEWWQLAMDGEALPTAASYTEVSDGERYELIFKVGY